MGKLFVITGPSGAGKDSVIQQVKELGLDFESIITTSTREIRPGEAEGRPYHFISRENFEEMIEQGKFLEWAEVYGNLYGSSKKEVEEALERNEIVILKNDPQGARTVKKTMPEIVTIFVMPPSFEYLEKRLIGRETDSDEVIRERLRVARREMEHMLDWDYLVVNEEGKLEQAAKEVIDIIESHV
jgi:guanylate kinase